jgi:threonine dehydrogenase-like Zn-dependent dehydrogenase
VVRNEIQLHTTFNAKWSNNDQALRLMAETKIDMKTLIAKHALAEVVRVFDAALDCDVVKPVLCPLA